jgi:predicted transcriptional regulator
VRKISSFYADLRRIAIMQQTIIFNDGRKLKGAGPTFDLPAGAKGGNEIGFAGKEKPRLSSIVKAKCDLDDNGDGRPMQAFVNGGARIYHNFSFLQQFAGQGSISRQRRSIKQKILLPLPLLMLLLLRPQQQNILVVLIAETILNNILLLQYVKYRSRMDIAASMLETADGGALKTRIMYNAFVSFPQLEEYLELLTDAGLIEYVKEEKVYHTTDKGRRFLKMYREVDAMVPRENMLTKITHR